MAEVHYRFMTKEDLNLISYADDLLLMAGIRTTNDIELINTEIKRMNETLKMLGLSLHSQKTNTLLITKKRDKEKLKREITNVLKSDGGKLTRQKEIKYLGMILDENLNFNSRVNYILDKIKRNYRKITALYNNIYGLKYTDRKILYSALFRSIIEYGSTVYYPKISDKTKNKIKREQRKILLGVISAYRTVSYSATNVIAGILPINLQIERRNEVKNMNRALLNERETRERKGEIYEKYLNLWQTQFNNEQKGRRTYAIIPNIKERIQNEHLKPDFYVTQFLTGHGNFGEYLKKYKITDNDKCLNCNIEIDTPDHTFQCCSAFREIREKFKITENYSD